MATLNEDIANGERASSGERCWRSGCAIPATYRCKVAVGVFACVDDKCDDCVPLTSPAPAPCPGCETLRSLLRLALGKLRDVDRAGVSGAIDSIDRALDEVGR